MIELNRLSVNTSSVKYLDVSWEIKNTQEDPVNYLFYVYKSGAEEGPFSLLTPLGLSDKYMYRDSDVSLGSNHRDYFYKVRVTEITTGNYNEYGPERLSSPISILALEIARKQMMLLEQLTGRLSHIYKIRRWGARCPHFDEKLQKHLKSDCLTCFNTNYLKGYHTPIVTYVQIIPGTDNLTQTQAGDTENTFATIILGNYPIISPRDVIVDNENNRWRIQSGVQSSYMLGAVVSQRAKAVLLSRSEVEYKLPKIGTEYLNYPSASHNYERIMDYSHLTDMFIAENTYGDKTIDHTKDVLEEHQSHQDYNEGDE